MDGKENRSSNVNKMNISGIIANPDQSYKYIRRNQYPANFWIEKVKPFFNMRIKF